MNAHVTSLWGALLAPLYVFLTARVIRLRRRGRIDMGTGGNVLLERYVRSQANFVEAVPFALMLLLLLELAGMPDWLLHLLGTMLLAGRISHAWSFSSLHLREPSRIASVFLTQTMITGSALLLLAGWIPGRS